MQPFGWARAFALAAGSVFTVLALLGLAVVEPVDGFQLGGWILGVHALVGIPGLVVAFFRPSALVRVWYDAAAAVVLFVAGGVALVDPGAFTAGPVNVAVFFIAALAGVASAVLSVASRSRASARVQT